MRITEITISASRTVNLGNYNSLKVEGSCTIALEEGEDQPLQMEVARKRAIDECKAQMEEAFKEVKPK